MLVPAGQHERLTMQSAAAATGNGTAAICTSGPDGAYTTLTMQVIGTFTATITWEGMLDGTTWQPIQVKNLETNVEATTATAPDIYRVVCVGIIQVRARISAYTSGSVTVIGVLVA